MFLKYQVSVCWPSLNDLSREERVLVIGMSATGILISKKAGFVNFALRHIFVLPMISGLVLEKKSTDELHCPASLSEVTDSF